MRWGVPVLTLVVACGGSQGASPDVVPATRLVCPLAEAPELPPEPKIEQWWKAGQASCPDGTILKGAPPPVDDEIYCEAPDGTRRGRWTWWYGEGRPLSDGSYDDTGAAEGEWVGWHENGRRKMQGSYAAGKKTGRWLMWHENGVLSTDLAFVEGKMQGPWSWWYENGKLAGVGSFDNELPHGEWSRCDADGYVTKIEVYEHDRLVKATDY